MGVAAISAETTALRWALHMAFWILLTGGFILLFAIWAARRVAKPLTRFAEAADRLGVDVNAPPLPETGAAELRKASRAFNRMQDRLRRFIEDRTHARGVRDVERVAIERRRLEPELAGLSGQLAPEHPAGSGDEESRPRH